MNRRTFLTTIASGAALALIPSVGLSSPISSHAGVVGVGKRRVVRALDFYDRGRWVRGMWADLKKGMIFRVVDIDRNGRERIADQGTEHEVCIALGNAFREPAPTYWGVKCEPFTFITMNHPWASRIKVFQSDGTQLGFVQKMNVAHGIATLGNDRMHSDAYVEIIPT